MALTLHIPEPDLVGAAGLDLSHHPGDGRIAVLCQAVDATAPQKSSPEFFGANRRDPVQRISNRPLEFTAELPVTPVGPARGLRDQRRGTRLYAHRKAAPDVVTKLAAHPETSFISQLAWYDHLVRLRLNVFDRNLAREAPRRTI